jgi:hypothetical protein
MNIPDKVRIGGMDYEIKYEARLNDGSQLLCGQIDYNNTIIKLAPNLQSNQNECQTLLHEIIHGIVHHFELEIDGDEDTVDKLAKGLYMVISDNPDMFLEKT